MWTNIKSIANEAIEAAIDIKHHIVEVTAEDVEGEETEKQENERKNLEDVDVLVGELNKAIVIAKEFREKYENAAEKWEAEREGLREQIRTFEGIVAEKDREAEWEAESYRNEIQDLMKAKNKVQREAEKAREELEKAKNHVLQDKYMSEKAEALAKKVRELETYNKELREEITELKNECDKKKKNEEDAVNRSFFIQFLSTYSRNIYNFQERQEMMETLVNILHLTNEEKSMLGLEIKPKSTHTKPSEPEEISLFDKFTTFISGLNSSS